MGTLYRRFPTKEALVDELARQLMDELAAAARTAATRSDGTATRAFLDAVGEQFARHGGLLSRLWVIPADPEQVAGLRAVMAAIVAADQVVGSLRPDVTAADLSLALWGLQGVVETAGVAAPQAWRRHVDLMLAGMGNASASLATPAVGVGELDAVSVARSLRARR